jgi:hypothetical protein
MNRKKIGWIALTICLAAVAITALGTQQTSPQSAAAATPSPKPALSSAVPASVISAETTRACQSVWDRILIIERVNAAEVRNHVQKPLAAMDEMVSLHARIDTSMCPPDFRVAVWRYVSAENAARYRAHKNQAGMSDAFFTTSVECITTNGLSAFRSPQAISPYNQKLTAQEKEDYAKIQSTFAYFAKIANKYGVK